MSDVLVVLATAHASAGKEAELEEALREAAAPTQAMPGCLDHDRHLQAPHVATLMQRFDGVLAAPPQIAEMRPLS